MSFWKKLFGGKPTVKIGSQEWMTENLNVDRFRNGDTIPEAKSNAEWEKAGDDKKPAWCYYDNDPANGKIYGKLYNWYAVNDPRGLAPEGWHIPIDEEWTKLTDYLGGKENAGGKLKSTSMWISPNTGATNTSGFSGLPGGNRDGYFYILGGLGYWWSSSEYNSVEAWVRLLNCLGGEVTRYPTSKHNGLSVRCLKD